MMIEQPLGWDDICSHAELQRSSKRRFASTNASTTRSTRARQSHRRLPNHQYEAGARGRLHARRGAFTICARRTEFRFGAAECWSRESAARTISRSRRCRISRCPGDVSASKRYWAEDIIEPEVEVTPKGTIKVPSGPGIGYQPKLDRIEKLTVRREVLT